MARKSKKSPERSPATKTVVGKARALQSATENTRRTTRMFCIPPAAFARVARGIMSVYGKDSRIGRISPLALRALQRFSEASMVDQIAKARLVMIGGKNEEAATRKTLNVHHLMVVDHAFQVTPGAMMEAL